MAEEIARIYVARAKLDDAAAMASLISPIPSGDQLAAVLQRRQSGISCAYDRETSTARYVVSNGNIVQCFTLTGISLQEAATVRAECDEIEIWDIDTFRAAAAAASARHF
jgi:hypothetical protein